MNPPPPPPTPPPPPHTHTHTHTHLCAVRARDGDPVSRAAQIHVALVNVHGHVVGRLTLRDVVGLLLCVYVC